MESANAERSKGWLRLGDTSLQTLSMIFWISNKDFFSLLASSLGGVRIKSATDLILAVEAYQKLSG